ncbi:hypothetical protein [Paenibacillus alvei]|uniref:Uncharacterized protein n=1 Tax=Paenibacillus alvei TaxID=44250 RepID=A0A383R9J9_PAEAL|nr:hypothetical protein [Paenibacillus alvei]SYX83628.1 conserved protein of unknown function [Paenibacillus alvei]
METNEYWGHHEGFADLIAIVASLHIDMMVDRLLAHTKGNLFSINELSRVGELSQTREIRKAFNDKKMSDVNNEPHDLSEPFVGGAFDVLVEVFQNNLIQRSLISKELGQRAYQAHFHEVQDIQREFEQKYRGKEVEFKAALLDSRDYFGNLMAKAWSKTSSNNLYYWKIVTHMIDADVELSQGMYGQTIRDCFEWRKINTLAVDPRLQRAHIVDEMHHTQDIPSEI